MYDDNNQANTDQVQVPSVEDSPTASPVYPTAAAPFDNSFSNLAPQASPDVDQKDQSAPVALPDPHQSENNGTTGQDDSALQDIKRTALQNLLPIVGRLDQAPEERFQTLLMVIQASDNRQLLNEAYETAAKIPDEGERAKALLAIINEINYFTQRPHQAT